ncbi:MAG: fumarylacetoacetase [Saprospiraceae bacterium]
MQSWLPIPEQSDFPIQNLPFGIFSNNEDPHPRPGIAIGEYVLDLAAVNRTGFFSALEFDKKSLHRPTLNDFIRQGRPVWRALRERVQQLLSTADREQQVQLEQCLVPQSTATMHLPVAIGDYTDFYSSEEHATNVGKMFRDPANALLPNWKHLPVAYHGRASSICVSGTNFQRPKGQIRPNDAEPPLFSPTRSLDFELEMAAIIGQTNSLGEAVSTAEAEDHIFGFVVFNDWSARDVQRWEYVPLGPFLAKNFFSSMSPWIVTLDALEPFRVAGPEQDPAVLPYLQFTGDHHFDVRLEVGLAPPGGEEMVICRSNFKHLYWNVAQQLAHHTVNGCNLQVGDLLASGTISGSTPDSFGSMLELTWGGKNPLQLPDGSERKFILDGDTVIMRAAAERAGLRIGFGEVRNRVLPTRG